MSKRQATENQKSKLQQQRDQQTGTNKNFNFDDKVGPTQIAEQASGEELFAEIENKSHSRRMTRDRQSKTHQ